jgi:RimJ/RimL family protein N-acetyltransferase
MELETERLVLRPWREDDAESLYKYAKDPEVGRAAGWKPHGSVEESRDIIKNVLSVPETYAVVLKSTGEPVGAAGIMLCENNVPLKDGEAELGYWLGVPYWGRGIIPEAVRELLKRCFEELCCDTVWCVSYEGNRNSERVQEKCGFRYHHTELGKPTPLGEIKNDRVSRITREEWERKR